jgi:hypothetical protein
MPAPASALSTPAGRGRISRYSDDHAALGVTF